MSWGIAFIATDQLRGKVLARSARDGSRPTTLASADLATMQPYTLGGRKWWVLCPDVSMTVWVVSMN